MPNEKPVVKTVCVRNSKRKKSTIMVSYTGEAEKGGDGTTYFIVDKDSIECRYLNGNSGRCSHNGQHTACYLIGIHELDSDVNVRYGKSETLTKKSLQDIGPNVELHQ